MARDPEFWWQAPEDEAHALVDARVRALETEQREVFRRHLSHARLYNNRELLSAGGWRSDTPFDRPTVGTSENVIQSVIDTVTAMIAKNRPKATFQTTDAGFSTRRKAKLLERFVQASWRQEKVYRKGVAAFRYGTVYGLGAIKVIPDHTRKRVRYELVPATQLVVDEREAMTEPPRSLHQIINMDRGVLLAMYPDYEEEIRRTQARPRFAYSEVLPSGRDNNVVSIIESWHLPSEPDADDGRHTITIETATLLDEPWKSERFPFAEYRWAELLEGWYGQGLAEQLMSIQLRINKLNRFIDKAQDLVALPVIFMDVASKISAEHLVQNNIARIIPYRGRPPTFLTPVAVGQEIYAYKEQLKRAAFEFAGVSLLSAQSKKPVGLDSAPALREYNDIETNRFAIPSKALEDFYLDLGMLTVVAAREVYRRAGKMNVRFAERSLVEIIEWEDADLEEDAYVMSIEASSILSDTPAGRMQQVVELGTSGLIDREEARGLIHHPDVGREMDMATAALHAIDKIIDKLRRGQYVAPQPYFALELGIKRVMQAYQIDVMAEDEPSEELQNVLELERTWIDAARAEMAKLAAPIAPPVPQVPAVPALAPTDQSLRQVQQQIGGAA